MLSLNNVEVIYDGVILVLKGVARGARRGHHQRIDRVAGAHTERDRHRVASSRCWRFGRALACCAAVRDTACVLRALAWSEHPLYRLRASMGSRRAALRAG